MRIIVCVFLTAALTGCFNPNGLFTRPGVTKAQRDAEIVACRKQSEFELQVTSRDSLVMRCLEEQYGYAFDNDAPAYLR